jgi:RWD domain
LTSSKLTSFAAALLLAVTYTPSYPDEPPKLSVTQSPDANTHPLLNVAFSSSPDSETLTKSLNETAEESVGTAMVFELVAALKEAAENIISARRGEQAAVQAAKVAKAEEEENRKFAGTSVTPETFMAWHVRFKKDMEDEERRKIEDAEADKKGRRTAAGVKEEAKLTGKQLWQQGLVGKNPDEEEEEDGLDGLAGVERLKISAS